MRSYWRHPWRTTSDGVLQVGQALQEGRPPAALGATAEPLLPRLCLCARLWPQALQPPRTCVLRVANAMQKLLRINMPIHAACRDARCDALHAAGAQTALLLRRTTAASSEPGIGVEGAGALLFGPIAECSTLPGLSAAVLFAAGCFLRLGPPTWHGSKQHVSHESRQQEPWEKNRDEQLNWCLQRPATQSHDQHCHSMKASRSYLAVPPSQQPSLCCASGPSWAALASPLSPCPQLPVQIPLLPSAWEAS
jgi:hypothetical protein